MKNKEGHLLHGKVGALEVGVQERFGQIDR